MSARASRPSSRSAPDALAELLPRAALGRDAATVATAWTTWRERVGFANPPLSDYRFLPLVGQALARHGVASDDLPRLRGIQKKSWSENGLEARAGGRVVAALQAAGLRPVAVDGLALAAIAHGDLGLRPHSRLALVVRADEAARAFAVMGELRYAPRVRLPWRMWPPGARDAATASDPRRDWFVDRVPFGADDGHVIALRWSALPYNCGVDRDGSLHASAAPIALGGVEVLAPSASELFVQVAAHAHLHARFGAEPPHGRAGEGPARASVDLALLARTGAVDAATVLAIARARGLGSVLRAAVQALDALAPGEVPQALVSGLQTIAPSPLEPFRDAGLAAAAHTPEAELYDVLRFLDGVPPPAVPARVFAYARERLAKTRLRVAWALVRGAADPLRALL